MPRHKPVTDAQYIERMKSYCDFDASGCWLYRGFVHKNGYGDMCYRGKNMRVHRLSYRLHKGEIPPGMDVCHTCDVRNCVNPDHLWVGTRKENVDDMTVKARHWSKVKTHCKHGHEFTPENTEIRQSRGKPGQGRACKTCNRIRRRMAAGWTREEAESMERIPSGYNRFGVAVMKVSIHSCR